MTATLGTRQDKLNKSMPVALKVKLGDVLADLIASANALRTDLLAAIGSVNTGIVIPVTLAIKAGSSAIVKTSALGVVRVAGVGVAIAANTDMAALVGTIATTKFAAWDFYVDGAGTLTASAKTADSASGAAALALLPAVPAGLVRLGSVLVQNAAGGSFIGGTTALDAASVTATYYNAAVAAIVAATVTASAVTSLEAR